MGSIFHKIKRATEHTTRMAKYAVEEGNLSSSQREQRKKEITQDSTMSEKEKRERQRAIDEVHTGKKMITAAKIIAKIVK